MTALETPTPRSAPPLDPGEPPPPLRGGRLRRRLLARPRGAQDVDRLVARGLVLGRGVYLGRGTHLDADWPWLIAIGDETTISANVEVLVHDASTKRLLGYTILRPVTIGCRVYVGLGAIVLPGVTIGDGAIVGAGSVVREDVEPGTLVAGNPARPLGDVALYAARHRALMQRGRVYSLDGWSLRGGITPTRMRQMREELRGRTGYVP